jgi:hypothetical protein
MQQLEDALSVSLCGHLMVTLATMCFAAFSIVTVQYEKRCMFLHEYTTVLDCQAVWFGRCYQHYSTIFKIDLLFNIVISSNV